jgi:hypothetical protein
MMGEVVRITKRGFVLETSEGTEESKKSLLTGEDIISKLREECVIDEGVTLRHLMQNVAYVKELSDFIDKYSHAFIDDFHGLLNEPPMQQDEEISFLKLSRTIIVYEDFFENEIRFGGIGINEIGQESTWGIMGDYVDQILDKPIFVDEQVSVMASGLDDEYEGYEDPESLKTLCEFSHPLSFVEVLDSIYWEISYYGPPEDSGELREEMVEVSEGVKSGKIETIPFEEVKRRFGIYFQTLKKIEELVVQNELTMDTWEEIWEYIVMRLDFDPEPSEEEMEEYKKSWMQQELASLNSEVGKGNIEVSTVQHIKSIFEEEKVD